MSGELSGQSDRASTTWTYEKNALVLVVGRRGGQVWLTLGVPPRGIAEEPEYTMEIGPGGARAVADALHRAAREAGGG